MELHMITRNISHLELTPQAHRRESRGPSQNPTQRHYLALVNAIPSALIAVGPDGLITDWNQAAERLFGIAKDQAIDSSITEIKIPWDADIVIPRLQDCLHQDDFGRLEDVRYSRPDGSLGLLEVAITALRDDGLTGYVLLATDITERKVLEGHLAQAQKLKSIGQLASGVAHEVNTPTQYIGDNIRFLKESYAGLERLLDAGQRLYATARSGCIDEALLAEIEALSAAIDVVYLRQEIPNAIQQSLEGLERVTKIVQAMKQFSHPDNGQKIALNLNKAIESTINVTRNEWKYVAEIKTEFDPALPQVPCLPGEFNQAILNIILNAVHAIEDACKGDANPKGIITIGTRALDAWVEIRISDTGPGIPPSARSRIFDPFFTTKEIGKGTGQGLSIAYNVITEKHKGTITFETEEGKGTTFIIRLPLQLCQD